VIRLELFADRLLLLGCSVLSYSWPLNWLHMLYSLRWRHRLQNTDCFSFDYVTSNLERTEPTSRESADCKLLEHVGFLFWIFRRTRSRLCI